MTALYSDAWSVFNYSNANLAELFLVFFYTKALDTASFSLSFQWNLEINVNINILPIL